MGYMPSDVGAENTARIRRLCIEMQPAGYDYTIHMDKFRAADPHQCPGHQPGMPYQEYWTPILPQLTQLTIVIEESPRARKPGKERLLEEWESFCEPILDYVSQQIRSTLLVELDGNDVAGTEAMIKKFPPTALVR
jgi:hypothetical protein